jgi:hypothetical protein
VKGTITRTGPREGQGGVCAAAGAARAEIFNIVRRSMMGTPECRGLGWAIHGHSASFFVWRKPNAILLQRNICDLFDTGAENLLYYAIIAAGRDSGFG